MNYIKFGILALLATNNLIHAYSQKKIDAVNDCLAENIKIEDCIETHCGGKTSVEKFDDCMRCTEPIRKCFASCKTNKEECNKQKTPQTSAEISQQERCQAKYDACFSKCSTDDNTAKRVDDSPSGMIIDNWDGCKLYAC